MALTTSIGVIADVHDYLNRPSDERLKIFIETITDINHAPAYWFDFPTIDKRMSDYGPDIYTLNYLNGKTNKEMKEFFSQRPEVLKTIPILLGIRNDKLVNGVLSVFDPTGDYELDFEHINISDIDHYMDFIIKSGLAEVLRGKSVHDYTYGVEAGLNSNGRKNRSGDEGESHLAMILQSIVDKYPTANLIRHEQTTYDNAIQWYNLRTFPKELENRRFDGSLFCPEKSKGLFAEVNNFNSSGSKSKGVASEFDNVHAIFARTPHVFVYITDGLGWKKDTSHLATIIDHVPNVLNYKMVEDGWLDDIAQQIMI